MQGSSSANATATENTQMFPIVPATFGDAEDWIGEPDGTWLSTSGTTCPPSVVEDKTQSFHAETQLKEGFGLILDIGSIGNLGVMPLLGMLTLVLYRTVANRNK